MREKSFKIRLTGILAISFLGLTTPAVAVDGSDAESPKVESVNLINLGETTSGSRVIIEVKTSDDKNKISLDGNINFETTYPKEFENLSPLCRESNRIGYGLYFNSGLGFLEDKTLLSSGNRIQQSFYLLTKYPFFKSQLPSGCPDLRNEKYYKAKLSLNLRDESGRTTSLNQSIELIPQPSTSISEERADYFCFGLNNFIPRIETILKQIPGNKVSIKYPDGKESVIDLGFVQTARLKTEATIKILNQPTFISLKNVPSCSLQEFQFLANRSPDVYQQVMLAAVKVSKKPPITITCVKGKLSKKISGRDPKCPAGYKRK